MSGDSGARRGAILGRLFTVFTYQATGDKLTGYAAALANVDERDLGAAVDFLIGTWTRGGPPPIATIRNAADEARKGRQARDGTALPSARPMTPEERGAAGLLWELGRAGWYWHPLKGKFVPRAQNESPEQMIRAGVPQYKACAAPSVTAVEQAHRTLLNDEDIPF